MNNNRHYFIFIISIIMIVSVFFMSCGIPTYCTLNKITISGSDKSFSITGTDPDLEKVSNGPGMIFCYTVGDKIPLSDLINNNENGIIKSFEKLVAQKKLNIDADNSILTITGGDKKDYTLYAFTNDNITVSSPSYNINLRDESFITNNTINAKFKIDLDSWESDNLVLNLKSNNEVLKKLCAKISAETDDTVYIYAAFSAEVGNFDNSYWSKLCYIGSVTK